MSRPAASSPRATARAARWSRRTPPRTAPRTAAWTSWSSSARMGTGTGRSRSWICRTTRRGTSRTSSDGLQPERSQPLRARIGSVPRESWGSRFGPFAGDRDQPGPGTLVLRGPGTLGLRPLAYGEYAARSADAAVSGRYGSTFCWLLRWGRAVFPVEVQRTAVLCDFCSRDLHVARRRHAKIAARRCLAE